MLAALWAPQIARFSSLFKYLQAVLSYTVPPVLAMYLLGLFWRRAGAGAGVEGRTRGTAAACAPRPALASASADSDLSVPGSPESSRR